MNQPRTVAALISVKEAFSLPWVTTIAWIDGIAIDDQHILVVYQRLSDRQTVAYFFDLDDPPGPDPNQTVGQEMLERILLPSPAFEVPDLGWARRVVEDEEVVWRGFADGQFPGQRRVTTEDSPDGVWRIGGWET